MNQQSIPLHLRGPVGPRRCVTGTTAAGQAVLLGQYKRELLCLLFDGNGHVEEIRARPDADETALLTWQNELGLHPGAIRISRFRYLNYAVGAYYLEREPTSETAEPIHDLILLWEREFFLNEDGTVKGIVPKETYEAILQLRLTGAWGTAEEMREREQIERNLSAEFSAWGLAECTGTDVGSGTANIFFANIHEDDWPRAESTILHVLCCRGMQQRFRLVRTRTYTNTEGEERQEHKVVWPKDFEGEWSILEW